MATKENLNFDFIQYAVTTLYTKRENPGIIENIWGKGSYFTLSVFLKNINKAISPFEVMVKMNFTTTVEGVIAGLPPGSLRKCSGSRM